MQQGNHTIEDIHNANQVPLVGTNFPETLVALPLVPPSPLLIRLATHGSPSQSKLGTPGPAATLVVDHPSALFSSATHPQEEPIRGNAPQTAPHYDPTSKALQIDRPLMLLPLTQLSYISDSLVPPSIDIEMELTTPKVATAVIPKASSLDPDPQQVQALIAQVQAQESKLKEQIDHNAQLTLTLEQEKVKILSS